MHSIKRHAMLRALMLTAATSSTVSLSGCGLGQTIAHGTADVAASTFTTPVKIMDLDLSDAEASKTCPIRSRASTAIRIYQLKTSASFETGHAPDFVDHDRDRLADNLLDTQNAVVRPGASISLHAPMQGRTRYVGIVALDGCAAGKTSRLLIPKAMWAKHGTVHIGLADGSLQLEDEPSVSPLSD